LERWRATGLSVLSVSSRLSTLPFTRLPTPLSPALLRLVCRADGVLPGPSISSQKTKKQSSDAGARTTQVTRLGPDRANNTLHKKLGYPKLTPFNPPLHTSCVSGVIAAVHIHSQEIHNTRTPTQLSQPMSLLSDYRPNLSTKVASSDDRLPIRRPRLRLRTHD